jgi:hypothetical protein
VEASDRAAKGFVQGPVQSSSAIAAGMNAVPDRPCHSSSLKACEITCTNTLIWHTWWPQLAQADAGMLGLNQSGAWRKAPTITAASCASLQTFLHNRYFQLRGPARTLLLCLHAPFKFSAKPAPTKHERTVLYGSLDSRNSPSLSAESQPRW